MTTVTISPKYQIVIPQAIRERLGLAAGQQLEAIVWEDRLELIPIRPMPEMRGFLAGFDTSVAREADRV